MKTILRAALLVLMTMTMVGPTTAQSLTLDQAKAQGLVGEQADGYLGIVQNTGDVQSLVERINLQRKDLYRDVARRNNLPLAAVEELAGEKAIQSAPAGTFVQQGGGWRRK